MESGSRNVKILSQFTLKNIANLYARSIVLSANHHLSSTPRIKVSDIFRPIIVAFSNKSMLPA